MAGKGGARPGAGRKPKAVEEDIAKFLRQAITPEKRQKIVDRFFQIAMGDNLKAAVSAGTLLLAYSIGKPTEKHEHSNPDGSPLMAPVAEAMVKVYGGK